MSKTTTSGKTPKPPRPMSAAAIKRAARADRDAQPLSEADLKTDEADAAGENHPPGSGTDARGVCRPLPYPARHTAGLGAGPRGTRSTHAGLSDAHRTRPGACEPHFESKTEWMS